LPVQRLTKLQSVSDPTDTKALSRVVPQALLARADEVIE
jgi:hypothetical protein